MPTNHRTAAAGSSRSRLTLQVFNLGAVVLAGLLDQYAALGMGALLLAAQLWCHPAPLAADTPCATVGGIDLHNRVVPA
jgi:hypothetical protein